MSLQQFLLILRARWRIALFSLLTVVGITTAVSLTLPKQYTATATVVIDAKASDPVTGMTVPALMMPGYIPTQIDIIQSDKIAERVVKLLNMDKNAEAQAKWREDTDGKGNFEQWLGNTLQKYLNVKPSRESSLIDIQYTSPEPRFAAIIANAFAQAYLDTSLDMRVDPARQTSTWFDTRVKQLKENLEKAQARFFDYQREHGVVSSDERLDVENARLSELVSQLIGVQGQRMDATSRQQQAHTGGIDTSPEALQNSVVMNLKIDIARAEGKLQDSAAQLGRNHPQIQRMEAELQALRQKLDAEMKKVESSLGNTSRVNVQRESEIHAAVDAQRRKVLGIKAARDEIANLQRDVDTAQKAYEMVSQRYNQTSLESQINTNSVYLLSNAVEPAAPSKPKVLLNILLSVFLGTLLGVGMAFLAELTHPRVRSAGNLAELLGVPVLGAIGGKPGRRKLRQLKAA